LGQLEERYSTEVVVIGIHSPKYTAEKDPTGVRAAVERNRIRHPVLNDPEMQVWDSYAVTAWPTLIFISPDGYVIGLHAGEARVDALAAALDPVIEALDAEGGLDRTPLDLSVSLDRRPASELAFPGKVLATPDRLFVSDSGHNRILIADQQGRVSGVIGSGEEGRDDGQWEAASFRAPQGMALDETGTTLYIADSENHEVRAAHLGNRTVTTVAGTGQQLQRLLRRGPARETSLSSPWDLTFSNGMLFIAMAGTHQVWMLDVAEGTIGVWAGTGHEGIRDGTRETAWLAQPMGIASYGDMIFISCAETQAVRAVRRDEDVVGTVVGQGLFVWGEVDGPAAAALFQHNQGIAAGADSLFVADTYNNRIRHIDRETSAVATLAGSGIPGLLDGPPQGARFNQPGGLARAGGTLYVADTNNHAIRTIDLDSGHVHTLTLSGV
jgi:hypothetical protein